MTPNSVAFNILSQVVDPYFIIAPETPMSDDDMSDIYNALESVMEAVTKKVGVKFNILIESADGFDGYQDISNLSKEQIEQGEEDEWNS